MTKTLYRTVGGKRHTARPRSAGKVAGSFDGMLARLGLASAKLQRARRKR